MRRFSSAALAAAAALIGAWTAAPVAAQAPQQAAADASPELSKVEGISIRRSAPDSEWGGGGGAVQGGVEGRYTKTTLAETLGRCVGWGRSFTDQPRMIGAENLPAGEFDVTFTVKSPKGDGAELFPAMAKAFESAFDVKVVQEEREVDAFALQKGPTWEKEGLPDLGRREGSAGFQQVFGFGPNAIQSYAFTGGAPGFAENLERILKKPVVDETKLLGRYEFQLRYRPRTALADATQYCAAHGLVLAPRKLKVPAVFIDKAPKR